VCLTSAGLGFNSISEAIGIINAKLNISPPHDSLPGNVKGDSLENVANQFFVHTIEVNGSQNCLVASILQNIWFYVKKANE